MISFFLFFFSFFFFLNVCKIVGFIHYNLYAILKVVWSKLYKRLSGDMDTKKIVEWSFCNIMTGFKISIFIYLFTFIYLFIYLFINLFILWYSIVRVTGIWYEIMISKWTHLGFRNSFHLQYVLKWIGPQ